MFELTRHVFARIYWLQLSLLDWVDMVQHSAVAQMFPSKKKSCGTSLNKPFQFLEVLELSEINIWDDEEGMIFPCLKSLTFRSCPKLNVGSPAGNFPSLEVISVFYCGELVAVFPKYTSWLCISLYWKVGNIFLFKDGVIFESGSLTKNAIYANNYPC